MLRNQFVEARLEKAKQPFQSKRRSMPHKTDRMLKLDNLMYIVSENEAMYKRYLGGRVRNAEIEQSML